MEPSNAKNKLRRKKPTPPSPIEESINAWFHSSALPQQPNPPAITRLNELVAQAPKRWTVYEPMVLLPSGSFGTAAWKQLLPELSGEQADDLWIQILAEISRRTGGAGLTHLAINEGIPAALHGSNGEAAEHDLERGHRAPENILRSPASLRMLHGDFGPASSDTAPGSDDWGRAFWVSTRQNGVFQTWAPRWTMFSRGNVKEKARLLDFHGRGGEHPRDKSALESAWAVDLYAGIGYFTFSYAKLGMRVLCWELNPWSVEGLRRGARGNGWTVRVVKEDSELALPMQELLSGGERIVVFLEDNKYAARRLAELSEVDIPHVNCGLLPTSDATWTAAWEMAGRSKGEEAWLHLHENVGVADIQKRKGEIEEYFSDLAYKDGRKRTAQVEHTELVKTFAPGVWHCVFDVYITKSSSII
ncbi:S-adenosyl-L-methionine-dependent methyltransferase [Hypoxylon fuscum]|nr:S-adenosyl-L-methionine-dependent methyltransferase [Hypoxylon fuscum]